MSGVTYWLQKQRKGELVELAKEVGMENYENLLKTDLEVALEEHLRANQPKLQNNPTLEPYYRRITGAGSPVKRESSSTALVATGGGEKGTRARRQTRGRVEESDAPSDSDAAAFIQTPRQSLSFARNLPLPPSPAVLADRIDASTSSLRASVSTFVSDSPVPGALVSLRNSLSSVTSLQMLVLFVEAWGLRAQVLPLRYLTTIPPIPALGIASATAVKIPDLFALLTMAFWGPFSLWAATSFFLPLLGAWFVNLTKGEKVVDPLVFSTVKGLATWILFTREGWGGESRELVESSVPGGTTGMLVGAGVGGLVSFWERLAR